MKILVVHQNPMPYHNRFISSRIRGVLTWVINGEHIKSGSTTYIPKSFSGFSKEMRISQKFSEEF